VSFDVILNISGSIDKTCFEPLLNATKVKLEQHFREQCVGDQFKYNIVFQDDESQWKPSVSQPVYQVTIPVTVETIVPDPQVHLAKVCVNQFLNWLNTSSPIIDVLCNDELSDILGIISADCMQHASSDRSSRHSQR
jgi:hypothetical protein